MPKLRKKYYDFLLFTGKVYVSFVYVYYYQLYSKFLFENFKILKIKTIIEHEKKFKKKQIIGFIALVRFA